MAKRSVLPAHNILAISRRKLRQPGQTIDQKANVDIEYDHGWIFVGILPVDQKRCNRQHITQQTNRRAPKIQTVNLPVLIVRVQWIPTLDATSFDVLVVAGRRVGDDQRRYACARCVELDFAHVVVALGGKERFVALEEFWEEWRFVEEATRFEGDATLLERRQEHHVAVGDAFAFRNENSAEKWLKKTQLLVIKSFVDYFLSYLNYCPALGHVSQSFVGNHFLTGFVLIERVSQVE